MGYVAPGSEHAGEAGEESEAASAGRPSAASEGDEDEDDEDLVDGAAVDEDEPEEVQVGVDKDE